MHQIEVVYDKLIPFETTIKNIKNEQYIMQISPFRTSKQEIKGIVLSFVDVTQITGVQHKLDRSRDKVENISEELVHQAKLFSLLTENANDLISIYHVNKQKLEYVSPSATAITGYSLKYLKGKDFLNKT